MKINEKNNGKSSLNKAFLIATNKNLKLVHDPDWTLSFPNIWWEEFLPSLPTLCACPDSKDECNISVGHTCLQSNA